MRMQWIPGLPSPSPLRRPGDEATCAYDNIVICYVYLTMFIIHVALSQFMQDEVRETALIAASKQGHIECATVLLNQRADVNYQRKVRLLYVE